jgi:hypothetical protein
VSQPRLSLVSAVSLSWLSLVSLGSVLSHPCFTLVSSWLCLGSVASQPWLCLGSALSQPCLSLVSVLVLFCLSLVPVLALSWLSLVFVLALSRICLFCLLCLFCLWLLCLPLLSPQPHLHVPQRQRLYTRHQNRAAQIIRSRLKSLPFGVGPFSLSCCSFFNCLYISTCMICVPLGPGVLQRSYISPSCLTNGTAPPQAQIGFEDLFLPPPSLRANEW